MKRKYSLLLALPATNALSLANFQSISLTAIPIFCQITYDGQIPSCQVSDFKTGCTPACLAGLDSIGADVIDACASTHVTSKLLLGIIQDGGIRGALCPTLAKGTTTSKAKTTSAAQASTSPAIESVTLPTDSVGVTGGLGFQTSTAATAKGTTATSTSSIVPEKSTLTTVESTSTSESAISSDITSSARSAATEATPTTITTTIAPSTSIQTSSGSSSSKPTKPVNENSNTDSGGGSPFDIQSRAERIGGDTMVGFLVFAAWASILATR